MVGPMVWYDEPDRSTPVDAAHLNQYSADLAASAAAADASATAAAASAALAVAPTDAAVATIVGNPASATRVSLGSTFVTTSNRPVSLRGQAGIDFTGATDSAAAVQAVITAAGAGAKIDLGVGGKIRCDTGLTLLNFQKLEGPIFQLGTATPAAVEINFSNLTGSAVGITCAASNVFSNVLLRGPGYTAATQIGVSNGTSGSPEFDHVQFFSWPTAVQLTSSFYTVFNRCEWRYNAVGVSVNNCTNLNFYAPRFLCQNIDNTAWGAAIKLLGTNDAPVNIFGGSLENYQIGLTAGARSQVNLFGVYFESAYATSPIGIQAASADGACLNVQGCQTFMEGHNAWVSTGGGLLSTLVGSGNTFIATTGSSTTPLAYTVASGGTLNVSLKNDNWARVAKGTYYGGTATLPRADFTVIPPLGATGTGSNTGRSPDIQTFTANGTWTKPTGATKVAVLTIGAGAGGGAGARGPSGTALSGGGGGGAGGLNMFDIPATALGATVGVVVPIGGLGAVGQVTDGTAGAAGSPPATGIGFGPNGVPRMFVGGGGGGLGAAGTAGTGAGGILVGTNGAAGSATGGAGTAPIQTVGAPGGASGGGITTTPTNNAGGPGLTSASFGVTTATAGTAGGGAGGNGIDSPLGQVASSGAGGGGNTGGAGGAGGNGGAYGTGGGGGGASLNGSVSGPGGNGGGGLCIVTTYF